MINENRTTEVKSVEREPASKQRISPFRATQLVWLFFGILEAMIALRILLKIIAANPNSPIASLIYSFTGLFLAPFAGLTATPTAGGMVLELSSLIAMVIYGLIAWALERIIWVVFYREHDTVVKVTKTTSSEDHTD